MIPPRILFLTLKTFSLTGGVEKVCRGIASSLGQMEAENKVSLRMISLYDDQPDTRYISKQNFAGYKGKRLTGALEAVRKGLSSDILVLSHVNLAPIGLVVKLLKPKTRVILWAHGIEVWRPLSRIKKAFLKSVNTIVAVSNFTARTMSERHQIQAGKIKIIPNALDPYFLIPEIKDQSLSRRTRYSIPQAYKVFFALTRLSITEKNKHYDEVICVLAELKKEGHLSKYILAGKYDQQEFMRLKEIARESGFEEDLMLPGFIPDEELASYYELADAFVLPSTKEGFGIAFIEAQSCGLKVLAGNKDGSNEAVRNELAGILIDPFSKEELKRALKQLFEDKTDIGSKKAIQAQCLENFAFPVFQKNIEELMLRMS